MKRIKGLAAAALLAAAVGLALPVLSAALLDRYQAALVTADPMESPALERSSAWVFADRLEHAGVSMVQADLRKGQTMDAGEALEAAAQILEEMAQAGVAGAASWHADSAKPYLAAASDSAGPSEQFQSYTVWRCMYTDGGSGEMGLLLDEQTGKLLALDYLPATPWDLSDREAAALAQSWSGFCAAHYGYTAGTVRSVPGADGEQLFEIPLTTPEGRQLTLELSFTAAEIQFQK